MPVTLVASVLLALALQGFAVTVRKTLPIVNKAISPDGFNRSLVDLFELPTYLSHLVMTPATVLS
jgi:hypothetical protein